MLLIKLHHFFVELLAIVAILILQTLHFGLNALHLKHRLGALESQRENQHHDDHGDKGDGRRVIRCEVVELANQPGGGLEHVRKPFRWGGLC